MPRNHTRASDHVEKRRQAAAAAFAAIRPDRPIIEGGWMG
jgi:hypothetical protein